MTSLLGSVTASYAYRADGMRGSKQTGGVTTRYRHEGQMGIEDVEVSSAGTTVTRYGIGARGIDMIERTNSSGTLTAYHTRRPRQQRGEPDQERDELPDRRPSHVRRLGMVRAQQSGGDPKLRYCASLGHKADDESGLIYMRAWYYEPTSGRFVSEDPLNRYDQDGQWDTKVDVLLTLALKMMKGGGSALRKVDALRKIFSRNLTLVRRSLALWATQRLSKAKPI